jgi:hypothetical protein
MRTKSNTHRDEQLKLLATNGMLIKRPLIVADTTVLTGFKESEWEEILRNYKLLALTLDECQQKVYNVSIVKIINTT